MKDISVLNKTLLVFLVLIVNCSFSQTFHQFNYFYNGASEKTLSHFEYHDKFYDASLKGLKKFVSEVEMSDNLNFELKTQIKKIQNKKIISGVAFFSGFALGTGIMLNESFRAERNGGEKMNTGTLLKGLGVFAIGGIINLSISPNKSDYLDFVNIFNKERAKEK